MSSFFVDVSTVFPPANNFTSLGSFVNLLLPTVFYAAGAIFFIMILVTGFSLIQAGGNAEELKKSQKLLTYSLVGFVVILMSYLLVKLVGNIFNINNLL